MRPSMRTLRLIADRLGQPVHRFVMPPEQRRDSLELLESNIILARVETLVVRGHLAAALATVMERLPLASSKREVGQLCYLAARCHVRSSRPLEAIGFARRARSSFDELGDERMVVECIAYEAAALGMEEDRMALETGHEALRRCHGLDPIPHEIETLILSTLAGIHLTRHEWSQAMSAYESAAEAAEVKDLEQVGQVYDGLSLAYQGMGDLQSALRYAYKALDVTVMRQNQLSLARAENNLGLLLMRVGRWNDAENYLRRSLGRCEEAQITAGRCHVTLSIGQLCLQQGDYPAAERAMLEAAELAEASSERLTAALARQWLGKLYASSHREHEADRCFLAAISMLNDLDARQRLAECHSNYAQVLSERDDLEGAVRHWQAASQLWHPAEDGIRAQQDLAGWGETIRSAN